jgi:hypothetical protein
MLCYEGSEKVPEAPLGPYPRIIRFSELSLSRVDMGCLPDYPLSKVEASLDLILRQSVL